MTPTHSTIPSDEAADDSPSVSRALWLHMRFYWRNRDGRKDSSGERHKLNVAKRAEDREARRKRRVALKKLRAQT